MSGEHMEKNSESTQVTYSETDFGELRFFKLTPKSYRPNRQYFLPTEVEVGGLSLQLLSFTYCKRSPWIHWQEPVSQTPLYFLCRSTQELYASIRSQRKTP